MPAIRRPLEGLVAGREESVSQFVSQSIIVRPAVASPAAMLDVAIVGGGVGGFGLALALLKHGATH